MLDFLIQVLLVPMLTSKNIYAKSILKSVSISAHTMLDISRFNHYFEL